MEEQQHPPTTLPVAADRYLLDLDVGVFTRTVVHVVSFMFAAADLQIWIWINSSSLSSHRLHPSTNKLDSLPLLPGRIFSCIWVTWLLNGREIWRFQIFKKCPVSLSLPSLQPSSSPLSLPFCLESAMRIRISDCLFEIFWRRVAFVWFYFVALFFFPPFLLLSRSLSDGRELAMSLLLMIICEYNDPHCAVNSLDCWKI